MDQSTPRKHLVWTLTSPTQKIFRKETITECKPCGSLTVGTPFASEPRRRIARSGVPQFSLFEDGDMLGDLKAELSEQGNARRILISDPGDQRFLRDW